MKMTVASYLNIDICWIVEPGEVTEDPSSVQITLHKFLCDYLLQQSRLIKTGE